MKRIPKIKTNLMLHLHKSILIIFIISLLLIVSSAAVSIINKNNKQLSQKISLEEYASKVLTQCSLSSYHADCYDKEIPKLMDKPINLSMEDAFKVTQLVQDKDPSYQYCHVLGHNLSTKETKKDPSKWKDVITRCPNGICANGCLHGSLMERFKNESLSNQQLEEMKTELEGVCEAREGWNPTRSQQAFCFHGLGHLLMYATKADINKSVEFCNLITSQNQGRDFSRQCFDGSFMQIFQQLDSEDLALIKGKEVKKDQVPSFCNQFPKKVKTACIVQSWPLYAKEIFKPEGLVKFCSYAGDLVEKRRCYYKSIGIITTQLSVLGQDITDKVERFCLSLPSQDEVERCFATVATRLVQNDIRNGNKAAEVCLRAKAKVSDYCFSMLSTYAKKVFHLGSAEFEEYCNLLPDPWNKKCLGGDLQYHPLE